VSISNRLLKMALAMGQHSVSHCNRTGMHEADCSHG
jgi:hypothetical protein